MDKKNNKIVIWEGFRKELPWILLWLLLGVMCYGYYQDKQICEEVLYDPCGACYKLNQELIDSDGVSEYDNIYINESILQTEDNNPNARTISNYIE